MVCHTDKARHGKMVVVRCVDVKMLLPNKTPVMTGNFYLFGVGFKWGETWNNCFTCERNLFVAINTMDTFKRDKCSDLFL